MLNPPALLMGVPLDDVTMGESLDLIADLVNLGRAQSRHFQIATVNVDFLTNAIEHEVVRRRLQEATVCLVDGTPPMWAATALGMPLRERVAGSDLVPGLFAAASSRAWTIHCLGSSAEVASDIGRLVAERFPAATITADPGPRIGADGDAPDDLIDGIAELDPDILLVALGHPKQEHFIAVHGERLGVPVMMGIGGTLDMLVGKRIRAPRWMRKVGLEWVFRALQEPRRLVPRYARDIRIAAPAFYHQWSRSRRHQTDGRWTYRTEENQVHAAWTPAPSQNPTRSYTEAVVALRAGSTLTIDDANSNPGDADLAQLFGLYRAARAYGRDVEWRHPPGDRLMGRLLDLGVPPIVQS